MTEGQYMKELDILILAVEAGVALTGFAGIIAAFQFGEGKDVRRGDVIGLSLMIQWALFVALAAAIPLLLYSLNVKETIIWTISSVTGAFLIMGGMLSVRRALAGVGSKKSFQLLSFSLQIVSSFCIVLYILNSLNVLFHRESGPLIFACIWFLSLSGFMFSRMLLLPIWRRVREQEATRLVGATSE